MSTDITRQLPNDEYQAAVGANSPTAANPFATIADTTGGTADTIYTADDTVLTNRTATVTDTLTWSEGRTVRDGNKMSTIINGVKTIEICALADFPTPIASVISLEKDTTYLIRGVVDILDNRLDIQVDNAAIVGDDRNKDILKASTLTGVMITVGADVATVPTNTEYNFTLDNIGLQAPLGKILEASNIDKTVVTGSVFGRTKVLQISNCEIRDTKDVWTIVGFELVDLLNNLIWFINGTVLPIGCQFQSVRHLELSSCEVFNWSNTTANVSNMIELLDDYQASGMATGNLGQSPGPPPAPPSPWTTTGTTTGTGITTGQTMTGLTSGATADVNVQIVAGLIAVNVQLVNSQTFQIGETVSIPPYNCAGCPDSEWSAPLEYDLQAADLIHPQFNAVVNINGSIVHPEYDQVGLLLNPLSTTKFGTIAANTFINDNLNAAGSLFLPEQVTPTSGILPDYSVSESLTYDIFANQGLLNSISGSVSTLSSNTTATIVSTNYADVNTGAAAATQAAVRFTAATNGIVTYNGKKQVYCSIHASLSLDSGGNDDTYTVGVFKDSGSGYALLPGSEVEVEFDGSGGFSLDVGTIAINYGTLFSNGDAVKMQIKSTGVSASITIKDYQLVIRE
jgi:hypothetical protein